MTALQDLIGDMKSVRAYIQNFHGEYYEGQRVVYDTMIEVATELLEAEKRNAAQEAIEFCQDVLNHIDVGGVMLTEVKKVDAAELYDIYKKSG